jgi:hypothetical protein
LKSLFSGSRITGVALLVGAALLLGLAQTSTGKDALVSLGVRSHETGFTELSFSRPATLPDHLPTGSAKLAAPFLIRNAEGHARSYAWTIEQRDGRAERVLAKGTTPVVPRGQALYVNPALSATCSAPRVQTVVRLAGLSQSVTFWSSCAGAQ